MTQTPFSPTVVVITGPVGAGKTTTANALFELLVHRQIAVVLYDMDAFRHVHRLPTGDAFAADLGYRAVAGAWRALCDSQFDDPGMPHLALLADVVETSAQRADYERAFPGARVMIVRLQVALTELVHRLEQREPDHQIDWYRQRAAVLHDQFIDRQIGDLVLEVGANTPEQLAAAIWLAVAPQHTQETNR